MVPLTEKRADDGRDRAGAPDRRDPRVIEPEGQRDDYEHLRHEHDRPACPSRSRDTAPPSAVRSCARRCSASASHCRRIRSRASGTRERNRSRALGDGKGPDQPSSVRTTVVDGGRSLPVRGGLSPGRFEAGMSAVHHELHVASDAPDVAAENLEVGPRREVVFRCRRPREARAPSPARKLPSRERAGDRMRDAIDMERNEPDPMSHRQCRCLGPADLRGQGTRLAPARRSR